MLSHRDENTQRIAALDEQAEALKLKPGLGLADARARYPSIDVVEGEPEADRRLLEALADWCDRYTPLVAIDGKDGLLLDITGCAHLFRGEEVLREDILLRLSDQGFDARPGLASTPGAAWAAARMGLPPVAAGEEATALANLPLAALRIDPATRISLESVGLRTIGSILAAPRAPLVRRFGAELILRLDQALGRVEEAITPRLPVASLSAERHFPEPISRTEDVERLVPMLAASLKEDLERRGEGARRLQLALFRVDSAVSRISVGTSRPVREPNLISRLFRERFAVLGNTIDAGYGFDLARLAVLSTAQFEDTQTDLAGSATDLAEDLALFADRIRARLGEHALTRPVLRESHIPEEAFYNLAFAEAASPKTIEMEERPPERFTPSERPIRLFTPAEPIEVTAVEVPEGPPLRFGWRRAVHHVIYSEGPERIAPEWWRDSKAAPIRDYFRIEDEQGRRYWLFREGLYGASEISPRWFMQGLFA